MKYVLIMLMLASCGPRYHLKRAQHHIDKAKEKGAITNIDTVFIEKEVFVPSVRVDTLINNFTDTIRIIKDRFSVKAKVDTVLKTVYIDGECKADTVRIKVPVQVTTLVPGKKQIWWPWLLGAFIAGILFWAYLKR